MLFYNFSLHFTAFYHWKQCPFTAYCVQFSPNIVHNVNELSVFCQFTGMPVSYCSLIYLPSQSVCAWSVTWHTVNPKGGEWQHCEELYLPAMCNGTHKTAHGAHIQNHTVSWCVYSVFLSNLYWCSVHFPFAKLRTRPLKDIWCKYSH